MENAKQTWQIVESDGYQITVEASLSNIVMSFGKAEKSLSIPGINAGSLHPVGNEMSAKLQSMGATPGDYMQIGPYPIRKVAADLIANALAWVSAQRTPAIEARKMALRAEDRYQDAMEEMMNDEMNDGVRMPGR